MIFRLWLTGPWLLPGRGRGHAPRVLRRDFAGERPRPVLEESHLQGHLQAGQRRPGPVQDSPVSLGGAAASRRNSGPPKTGSTFVALHCGWFIKYFQVGRFCVWVGRLYFEIFRGNRTMWRKHVYLVKLFLFSYKTLFENIDMISKTTNPTKRTAEEI